MVVVRWPEPDVAEDLALAPAVTDVVNRAYAHKEVGLFATKIERADIDDVRASISRRETAVALLEGPSSARSALGDLPPPPISGPPAPGARGRRFRFGAATSGIQWLTVQETGVPRWA